jgi:hypothetical protein
MTLKAPVSSVAPVIAGYFDFMAAHLLELS